MIKEICSKLKDRIVLANLPFAELVSGIVKAVTYSETNIEDNKTAQFIIPVSYDTNKPPCNTGEPPETEMVPDSSKRGILYMEDNGIQIDGNSGPGGDRYNASVTIVSWYNKGLILGNPHQNVQNAFINMLLKAIRVDEYYNLPPFTRVLITQNRIQAQDGAVFSKYTYRETDTQYLMSPFEYFAVDLNIRFTVPIGCILPVSGTGPEDCRFVY